VRGKSYAMRLGRGIASSDSDEILKDPQIDAVADRGRNQQQAPQACRARARESMFRRKAHGDSPPPSAPIYQAAGGGDGKQLTAGFKSPLRPPFFSNSRTRWRGAPAPA